MQGLVRLHTASAGMGLRPKRASATTSNSCTASGLPDSSDKSAMPITWLFLGAGSRSVQDFYEQGVSPVDHVVDEEELEDLLPFDTTTSSGSHASTAKSLDFKNIALEEKKNPTVLATKPTAAKASTAFQPQMNSSTTPEQDGGLQDQLEHLDDILDEFGIQLPAEKEDDKSGKNIISEAAVSSTDNQNNNNKKRRKKKKKQPNGTESTTPASEGKPKPSSSKSTQVAGVTSTTLLEKNENAASTTVATKKVSNNATGNITKKRGGTNNHSSKSKKNPASLAKQELQKSRNKK